MSKGEDLEKEKGEGAPAEDEAEDVKAELREESEGGPPAEPRAQSDETESDENANAKAEEGDPSEPAPNQLGYKRYVYAAYLAGAILIAFLGAKSGNLIWYRLAQWKPNLGEPKDEILMPIAALLGAGVAFFYYRKAETRQYANEVAEELSKVTWPTKKEVTNSTTVVIFTTLFATVYFALMDRFWGFVTNLVYGT